jgi:cytochrome c oxidase assembly protein subunit 15
MNESSRLIIFRRIALVGVLLALCVIVMGAWVRLSDAGLGCPDWPGCYGHLTAGSAAQNADVANAAFPHRPVEYHKAVKEMVHRYFASTLGFLILVLAAWAIANRHDPDQPVVLPIVLVPLVMLQGALGMWTVTLLLKPLIVVLHLLGGLATMASLAWLAMRKKRADVPATPVRAQPPSAKLVSLRTLALAGLIVLIVQIALGGWTSSNYAALACPDFPTCQNAYWPEMDVTEAFVLWRGLGIDYEGGVLDHPARVAIHFVHRLGAILAAIVLAVLSIRAGRFGETQAIRTAGALLGILLVVQLVLGPVMVMRALPLSLATAHNGVAALLVLVALRLYRLVRITETPAVRTV